MPMETGNKIESIAYLRVLAISMILYDHLGGMRNQAWIVKRILDYLFCTPLKIIQEFGAFGVSLFYLITGFLFLHTNKSREKCVRYYIRKIMKLYCYVILSFAVFGFFQWILHFVRSTYWSQFSLQDWVGCATLFYHFNGVGEMINGTTWFLLPLFAFYIMAACCHSVFQKSALQGVLLMEGILILSILLQVFLQSRGIEAAVCSLLPFIYIPVTGLILYLILQHKLSVWQGICFGILNYSIMTAVFYKLNIGYYSDEPYIISIVYAVGLFLCFIFGEKHFKTNRYVDFIGKISLSIYLIHMTWGGLFMSFFEQNIGFSISFVISVLLIILVAAIHHYLIEDLSFLKLAPKIRQQFSKQKKTGGVANVY